MHTFTFFASIVVLASVASTLAAPSQLSKRAFDCPPKDDNGGALIAAGAPDANQEVTCKYEQGGTCVYFGGNGTFSSGSSVCPNALVQGTGSSSTASDTATSADGTSTTSGSGTAAFTSGAAKTTAVGTTTSAAGGSTSTGSSTPSSSAAGTTATRSANGALTLAPRTWGIGAAVFALWFML